MKESNFWWGVIKVSIEASEAKWIITIHVTLD